jgi:serine/threonine-protein kinase
MNLVSGQCLGAYEILAPLGTGGMGEVFLARDTRLGREVAVKVLPVDTVGPERLQRFIGEARAAARLNHPNIIAIYDISEASGVHFIVMEYVPGKTLAEAIPPDGYKPAVVYSYARQIAASLAKAHTSGIVHRDLKPANIMVTGDGIIKVLDFGLAKLRDTSDPVAERTTTETQPGIILGTAAYMSPEQASGRPVDVRSDIFSLGLVLYEMVSGQRAFQGENVISTIAAILHSKPRPLREIAPHAPLELERLISRCLFKEPERRFQSAVELKLALENLDTKASAASTPTIAVLPFTNFSADRDNEYFSDGLAEEIISALTRVSGLRVTARTSAFYFRGKDVEIPEIGRRLGVDHLLEGSVRRAGSRIRVTVQLVKAADGLQIWSERYDREMTDVFAVQDEISQCIVTKLKGSLSVQPLVPSRSRHSKDPAAYSAYLRGRHHLWQANVASIAHARECFERAISLDSDYALAYAAIANCIFIQPIAGEEHTVASLAEAKSLLERALEIDSLLAEPRALLGAIRACLDYDWKGAASEFDKALAADTVSAEVLALYGRWFLWPQGRFEEALAVFERARKLDPLIPAFAHSIAEALVCLGKYEEGIQQARRALEIEPNFWLSHALIGWAFILSGKPDDAIGPLETARRLEPHNKLIPAGLAAAHLVAGRQAKAMECARDVVHYRGRAVLCYFLRDFEGMFRYLEEAVDQHDLFMSWFFHLEYMRPLRSDPRFQALIRKMNLTPRDTI